MELFTLRLKPLEPLMLRSHGEFDPSSRGVFSHALSLVLPRPSTVIGMFISTLMSLEVLSLKYINIHSWDELLKYYEEILDNLGIEAIRGPYISRHGHVYVPIRFGKKFMLVDYEQVRYFLLKHPDYGNVLEKFFSDVKDEHSEVLDALKTVESDLKRYELRVFEDQRVGIHLKLRGGRESLKVAEEGYIYVASHVSYPLDTEVVSKLIVKKNTRLKELLNKRIAVKLGGEHRVTRLVVEKLNSLKDAEDILNKMNFNYALLLTPMPLKKDDFDHIRFIGECDIMGFGYSIAKRCRKPLQPAILEGSILRVETSQTLSIDELLRYGLYSALGLCRKDYEILGRIGYASYIPLTLD